MRFTTVRYDFCISISHVDRHVSVVWLQHNTVYECFMMMQVRSAIRRIQDKRKALSFTVRPYFSWFTYDPFLGYRTHFWCHFLLQNCSQPISFLPSQKSPSASWVHSLPTLSSPESSESSTPMSANPLIFRNGVWDSCADTFQCFTVTFSLRKACLLAYNICHFL